MEQVARTKHRPRPLINKPENCPFQVILHIPQYLSVRKKSSDSRNKPAHPFSVRGAGHNHFLLLKTLFSFAVQDIIWLSHFHAGFHPPKRELPKGKTYFKEWIAKGSLFVNIYYS